MVEDTPDTAGGTDWELAEAWQMIETARLAHDAAAERLGWIRYSDGLRNRVVGALSYQLVPMLLELRAMRQERQVDARAFAHKLDLLMIALEHVQRATLSDQVGAEERGNLMDLARTIPELAQRIEALEADHHVE